MSGKKFHRDVNNKILGGVCSGLSKYFNIDLTIVRAIFVVLALLGSLGFWVYVILWLIAPKN